MTSRVTNAVCALTFVALTGCWDFDGAYSDYCASGRCSERVDAAVIDAGASAGTDAGTPTRTDAGGGPGSDAGRSDAGMNDAGKVDDDAGQVTDAGPLDAGPVGGCDSGLCIISVYETQTPAIWDLDGTSSNDVWVAGRRGTWFHYDGLAWSAGAVPNTVFTLWSCAVSPNFVWVGGDDGIFRRSKADGLWTKVRETSPDSVYGLAAVSDTEQFAAGYLQWVARSDGTSWVDEHRQTGSPSGSTGSLRGVSSRAGGSYAVGAFDNFEGIALKRSAGGVWNSEMLPLTDRLRSVYALDSARAWAVGDNGAVVERGSNDRWMRHGPFTTQELTDVWASSANDVWVSGVAGQLWHYDGARWAREAVGAFGTDYDFTNILGFGNELVIAANHNSRQGTGGNQFDGGVVIRLRR